MTKKKSSKKGKKRIPVKTDTSSVERETIKRAKKTLSTIEKFLSNMFRFNSEILN